jgi:hypothetical protein
MLCICISALLSPVQQIPLLTIKYFIFVGNSLFHYFRMLKTLFTMFVRYDDLKDSLGVISKRTCDIAVILLRDLIPLHFIAIYTVRSQFY